MYWPLAEEKIKKRIGRSGMGMRAGGGFKKENAINFQNCLNSLVRTTFYFCSLFFCPLKQSVTVAGGVTRVGQEAGGGTRKKRGWGIKSQNSPRAQKKSGSEVQVHRSECRYFLSGADMPNARYLLEGPF